MFRRGLCCLVIACAPALAACSLLLGEGFTGSEANPASDSGATSPDSTNRDSTDGNDGGTPTTDASPDADGGFVCPPGTVSFCDGFNRDTVQGPWEVVHQRPGGTLAIGSSGGGAKHLESAVTAVGGQAQLSKSFGPTPQRVHLELTLEISSLASAGGVYVGGLSMPNGSNPPTLLYLYVSQFGLFFVEQVADGAGYAASNVPVSTGAPHRVVFDVTFGGRSVVTVDDEKKVDKTAESFLSAKAPTVYLGASSIDGTGNGVALKIDDFVFTAD